MMMMMMMMADDLLQLAVTVDLHSVFVVYQM